MIFYIYRPEITLYERDEEGVWVAKSPTVTNTLFHPLPDMDRQPTEGGFLKTVEHGETPAYTIEVSNGAYLEHKGRALYLFTRSGKAFDATTALIAAKTRFEDFRLVRAGDAPVDPELVPVVANKPAKPEPKTAPEPKPFVPMADLTPVARKPGKVKQMSFFEEMEEANA